VNWIDNTLGIRRTSNILWEGNDAFDFRIFDSPQALENAIREKAAGNHTARMTAGFCWKWSLARGIPKATLWAHSPGGIDQIGCIYTAQGFEFDYVGVIFGEDLVYRFDRQDWIGDKGQSFDNVVRRSGGKFIDLVKSTYRVLLSRGMKGCYVYFMDKETERFVRSRIEVKRYNN